MAIMADRHGCIEEVVKVAENVERRYCEKKSAEGAHTGVPIAKNNWSLKKGSKKPFFNILPGIELFFQGATPQRSSPLMRFTTEFGMDRSGTTPPWTPG